MTKAGYSLTWGGFPPHEQGAGRCISAHSYSGSELTPDNSFYSCRKAIAFHTFSLLFFGVKISRWASLTALVGANAIIILLVCLGPMVLDSKTRGPFCAIILSFFTHIE